MERAMVEKLIEEMDRVMGMEDLIEQDLGLDSEMDLRDSVMDLERAS